MKTMRRKSHKMLLEDIEPTGSTNGGEKKLLRSPHLIHLSLIRILQSPTVNISECRQNEMKSR